MTMPYGGGAVQPVLGAELVAQVEQETVRLVGPEEEADVGGGSRPVQALGVLQLEGHVTPEIDTHADTVDRVRPGQGQDKGQGVGQGGGQVGGRGL